MADSKEYMTLPEENGSINISESAREAPLHVCAWQRPGLMCTAEIMCCRRMCWISFRM